MWRPFSKGQEYSRWVPTRVITDMFLCLISLRSAVLHHRKQMSHHSSPQSLSFDKMHCEPPFGNFRMSFHFLSFEWDHLLVDIEIKFYYWTSLPFELSKLLYFLPFPYFSKMVQVHFVELFISFLFLNFR